MKKIVFFILVFGLFFTVQSCKKPAGRGGTSTIEGTLFAYKVTALGDTIAPGEYELPDEWVYIIYGEDEAHSDRFRTSVNGNFQFKNLTKGKYTVFSYSKCNECASGKEAISRVVNIDENKTTYTIDKILIRK